MRRLFIFQICCLIAFSPIQSLALVGDATRYTTSLISSISSNGAVYGGASGSNLVVNTTRSFAGGYAASASGSIQAASAGVVSSVETVALSRGATAGLLRLGLQAGKCLGYVGLVITAAQLAGLAWEWYQDEQGKKHFLKPGGQAWVPYGNGYLISSTTRHHCNSGGCYDLPYLLFSTQGALVAYEQSHSEIVGSRSGYWTSDSKGTISFGEFARNVYDPSQDLLLARYVPDLTESPPDVPKIPVPWDEVQKQIEDDLARNPSQWADPFKEAVKEVPPAVNPWLDKSAEESKASPAPVPMPDSLPYPTPSGSPSAVNPATGAVEPLPLPNELTKEDIAKVASEVLSSLKPVQVNDIQTADVTAPSANQDLAQQLSAALSTQIPQPPYDVKVINEPTIKIKTEDSWKGDAESAVGTTIEPDSNDSLDINLDLEKYKSKKRDLSFLDTIYNNIKSLPLFQLFNKNPLAISAGSPELCLEIPQFGNHCVNLNTYTTVFETIGSVVLALTFFTCLAIIFL